MTDPTKVYSAEPGPSDLRRDSEEPTGNPAEGGGPSGNSGSPTPRGESGGSASGNPGNGGKPGGPARSDRSKKRKKKPGGRGGESRPGGASPAPARRGPLPTAGGTPVEMDPQVRLGSLPSDELLRDPALLEESFQRLYDESGEPVDFNELYELPLHELRERARAAGFFADSAPPRLQVLEALLRQCEEERRPVVVEGCLERMDDGYGLLVFPADSYRVRPLSVFVSGGLLEKYGLQRGHTVRAYLQAPRENESCPVALRIESVMGADPAAVSEVTPFTELVPYYPLERLLLENSEEEPENNLSMRVVDLITPVGFGQRGLVVAPPRTGKTVLLQGFAASVQLNYPEAHLIVLLIDERPEEVTDFRRRIHGEVISSTFDESAGSHVHAAEMVIEKARRMVEMGRDVVILLDSITRLARAYNTLMPNSGKILSGGVEANALQKPKRFFGSARNIEEGGSLTIMGTALVETGSKMDEVIFEEFKGTGNMELHLDRGLVDKRIFPAIAMDRSGTRKEELLYHPDEMQKVYSLRRATKGVPPLEAMEMLIQRVKKTRSNAEFLMTLNR